MQAISSNCRIRHPEEFLVGEDSIVNGCCYFSTRVRISCFTHIASGSLGHRSKPIPIPGFSSGNTHTGGLQVPCHAFYVTTLPWPAVPIPGSRLHSPVCRSRGVATHDRFG